LALAVLLVGCGHVGAAIAKNTPEEYRWIGFLIAAVTLAVWSYSEWLEKRRLQLSHWFLAPMLGLSIFLLLSGTYSYS
jgi:hypothetical protein